MLQRESEREFHMVGAEKEKDLRPTAVLLLGISSELVLDDLRVLVGLYG